jgi:hypothetical protein
MAGLTWSTAAGDLTIGGVAMNCAGWKLLGDSLARLWMPADQRGDDRLIPGAAGVLAQRRRNTVTTVSLEMLISGLADRTGTAATGTYVAQLYQNIVYLRDNVVAPTGATDGTRSAVLTVPGGSTLTEPVHVVGLKLGDGSTDGRWQKAVLELSIPSGRIQ